MASKRKRYPYFAKEGKNYDDSNVWNTGQGQKKSSGFDPNVELQ